MAYTICLDCKVNPVLAPTCTQCRKCWDLEAQSIAELERELEAKKPAVNDHVCKACGNDKCSRKEKSCWKCGASINP